MGELAQQILDAITQAREKQDIVLMANVFSEAAVSVVDAEIKADLTALSIACGPALSANKKNILEFKPHILLCDGRRSAILEDLDESQLIRLARILPLVQDVRIRARIADVLWTRKFGGRECQRYCQIAIDNYYRHDISAQGWIAKGGKTAWKRAVELAKNLKKDSSSVLLKMTKELQDRIVAGDDPKMSCLWAKFILRNNLPNANGRQIINALKRTLDSGLDFHAAIECYDTISAWQKQMGDENSAFETILAKADYVVSWAEDGVDNGEPAVIQGQLEPVYTEVYNLPSAFRAMTEAQKTIDRIRGLLTRVYKAEIDTMQHFRGEPIDLILQIKHYEEMAKGKSAGEALGVLLNVYRFDLKSHKEEVEKNRKTHPKFGVFPMTQVDVDGRPIAVDDMNEWYSRTIYLWQIELVVKSAVKPMLAVMRKEHPANPGSFSELVAQSKFVPEDRREVFSKALYYGYMGDFETAAYLLCPQLENALRVLLKSADIETRQLDKDVKKERELSMALLVDKCQAIFESELAFELKTLFGRKPDLDLRDRLLHGNVPVCNGDPKIVYIWWRLLKMIAIDFSAESSLREAGHEK